MQHEHRRRFRAFTLVVDEEMVTALDRAAALDERTRQQQARYLLRQALAERGLLQPIGQSEAHR